MYLSYTFGMYKVWKRFIAYMWKFCSWRRKERRKKWRYALKLQFIRDIHACECTYKNHMTKTQGKVWNNGETVLFFFFGGEQILPGGWIQCQNIEFLIVAKLKTDSWSNSYREKMNIWDYSYLVTEYNQVVGWKFQWCYKMDTSKPRSCC